MTCAPHGPYVPNEAATLLSIIIICFALFVGFLFTSFMIWVWCRIFHKAGFPWPLGLLMLIPLVNVVMIVVLAFCKWPVQKELKAYKTAGRNKQPPPGEGEVT